MQKSQIRVLWSFRDGNYQSAKAWPGLGHKDQVKLSASRNDCSREDTSSLEEATARIDLDSTEYPQLTETAIKIKSTVATTKFCDLSHMSSTSALNYQGTGRSKAEKRYRRMGKIHIDFGATFQSSRRSRDISKPNGCTGVSIVTDSSNDQKIKKVKIRILKGKKPSKLKKIILLDRDTKAQINMQKRALFEYQKMEAISKDVNDINFSSLKITANNDMEEDYVKRMSRMSFYGINYRSTNEGIVSKSTVNPKPDVVEKLNGLHI